MHMIPSYADIPGSFEDRGRFSLSLRWVPVLLGAANVSLVGVAALCAYASSVGLFDLSFLTGTQIFAVLAATSALLIPVLHFSGLLDAGALIHEKLHLQKLLLVVVGVGLLVSALMASVNLDGHVAWPSVVSFFLFTAVLLVLGRGAQRALLRRALAAGIVRGPRIALISSCRVGVEEMADEFDRFGYSVVRKLDLPREAGVEEIEEVARTAVATARGSAIEEVLIAVDCVSVKLARPLLERLRETPLPIRLVLNAKTTELFSHSPQRVGDMSTFEIQRPPLRPLELASKRLLDVVVAGSCLLLLSPLLILTCIAIKLDTPGPVFFRQIRNGFNGRSFRIMKFRSMTVMENGATIVQAKKNDARVTRVGRLLRRTSIDELPQLLNVLRGEMSIVGPRPHAAAHDQYYSTELGNYAFRQHVAPGITGWAQVHGFRGETSTVEAMNQRLQHDIWYIDHWSLWLDIKILVRTPIELLLARNAY